MSTTPETGTPGRIQWNDDGLSGPVGSMGPFTFFIVRVYAAERWMLTAELPGLGRKQARSDDIEELKAEAERGLEEFVSSLGVSFGASTGPELAALRDERHRLLSLAAEILGSFERHCSDRECWQRTADVVAEQYEDWRSRAGLESGQERTGDGEPR